MLFSSSELTKENRNINDGNLKFKYSGQKVCHSLTAGYFFGPGKDPGKCMGASRNATLGPIKFPNNGSDKLTGK